MEPFLILAMVATAFVIQQHVQRCDDDFHLSGSFPVPAGVTSISIDAFGAFGGSGAAGVTGAYAGPGGSGGRAIAPSVSVDARAKHSRSWSVVEAATR